MTLGPNSPEIGEALYCKGIAYIKLLMQDSAIECFDEVVRVRKLDLGENHISVADAFSIRGSLRSRQGKTEDALLDLSEASRIYQLRGETRRATEVLREMGDKHRAIGSLNEAIWCYKECLRMEGVEGDILADWHVTLGDVEMAAGRRSDARFSYMRGD